MNSSILDVVDVHKEYRVSHQSVPVLKGLSLSIHAGEIVAILGHSGVGKSTLLNLLGLLDVPSSGKIVYQGRDESFRGCDLTRLNRSGKARMRNKNLGFVFQFYHLLPDLSVLENVLLPAMIRYGGSEFRKQRSALTERAMSFLERVGLGERIQFAPTKLSGGERQRAAIARALMNSPEIVYCDEPTGNLDTQTGSKIHDLILELNRETGTSFVIVTHDESLAQLAQRRLQMVDGLFREGG